MQFSPHAVSCKKFARRPTLWVCLSYIANPAHCTHVKCWYPLVCPHCWFFQQQWSDCNKGQSILHLTKTRLYNIYHYDTCQWSRVITHTGTQTPFKISFLPIKGCYYEEIFTWGVCEWTLLKLNLHRVRMMLGVSSIVPNINTERVKGILWHSGHAINMRSTCSPSTTSGDRGLDKAVASDSRTPACTVTFCTWQSWM